MNNTAAIPRTRIIRMSSAPAVRCPPETHVTAARAASICGSAEAKAGSALAQRLGAQGIAELRARPTQELLETRAVMLPTVDGWLLPDSISTLFSQGRDAPVPLLIAWSSPFFINYR